MSDKRTIERLWRDAVAAGRPTPAYLVQHGDEWRADLVGGGGGARRGLRERAARARRPQGRCVRDPRLEQGRVGALRLRARLDRRDRRRRSTRTARRRTPATSSITPSRSACSARTRCSARRWTTVRGGIPRLRHVLTFAELDDLAARGRAYAAEHPDALREARRRDRGGRPLHLHLHLRHDRAAEGLHDLAPQLLRHGRGRRRPAELHRPRGHDAPLPAARAQLRPPDAPLRRVRRLRDRVPARPAPGGRGAADREADRLPERAARLREDPHRRRRQVRRGDGREAEARRLGARRRPARQRAHAAPASRSRAGLAGAVQASRTGSSTRR